MPQKYAPIPVGTVFKNKLGYQYTVVDYISCTEVVIKFDNTDKLISVAASTIRNNEIKNRFAPSVVGVGILGDCKINIRDKDYRTWRGMLTRCYGEESLKKCTSYKGCTVCPSWQIFTEFKNWFDKQQMEPNWHLDKDLLVRGNKEYGPDTCVFVPAAINSFLVDRHSERGKYPIGVTAKTKNNVTSYAARCGVFNSRVNIGSFKTPELAFEAYKITKESQAKKLAEHWKDRIDPRAYAALLNFTVQITD